MASRISQKRGGLLRAGLVLVTLLMVACKEPYRVGEQVWVAVGSDTFPAFVKERRSATRFLVQFESCDESWVREVTLERIKGRVGEDTPVGVNAQRRFACVTKDQALGTSTGTSAPYQVGDRVRVTWRGSVYAATVVRVVAVDRFVVHYDGHEKAWDEEVPIIRIVERR
jgi:hypothetical protein